MVSPLQSQTGPEATSSHPAFQYQRQECSLTLRQGLEEYFQGHPQLLRSGEIAESSAALFRSHDLCHVLFGLDTTLDEEALADCWTVLATNVGWRRYAEYLSRSHEAREIFRQAGYFRIALITVRTLPRILRVFLAAWRVRRKWPWGEEAPFLETSLADLRHQFNIHLV